MNSGILKNRGKQFLILWVFILLSGFILFNPTSSFSQFTSFEAAISNFDAEVAYGVAKDSAGCITIAVFIKNRIIWSKGYGWADIENQVPATPETIGRTGSISKSFTALAMMQLAEQGIIYLDDPVEIVFPKIKNLVDTIGVSKPITHRMLASHTSGLIREPRLRGAAAGPIYFWENKIIESIPYTYFATLPGTKYSYSNIGFGILGLAVSYAVDIPFIDLVTENIFKPLGMTSSTFVLNTPELWARMSVGYHKNRKTGEVSASASAREHFGRGYKVPNGGIYSTVGDLAKFAAAMMGESPVQILLPESREEMLSPQLPAENYGLGFFVSERNGIKIAGHGGSVAGYNANLIFDPVSKIGVALLRTTSYNPNTRKFLTELILAN